MQAHNTDIVQHMRSQHARSAGAHWKLKFDKLIEACSTNGSFRELCCEEGAAIHDAVLTDCKGDEDHAAKVCAAFIVAEFCKVLKNGRTAATEAAANGNLEALTLMHELGMHLDVLDGNGETPLAAAAAKATSSAEHIEKLLGGGPADGGTVATNTRVLLEQPKRKGSAFSRATSRRSSRGKDGGIELSDRNGKGGFGNPLHVAYHGRGNPGVLKI